MESVENLMIGKEKRERIEIVPELASVQSVKQSFLSFLPSDALVVMKYEVSLFFKFFALPT